MQARSAAPVLASLLLALGAASPAIARAASAGPGWLVSSVAEPTNFILADNAKCSVLEGPRFCDSYLLTITNLGDRATSGQIRIFDSLPEGLRPVKMYGENLEDEATFACSVVETTCTFSGVVAPGGTLKVDLEVEVVSAVAQMATNSVTVTGGGAPSAVTREPSTMPNTIEGPPSVFGIADFGMIPADQGGDLDEQASDHPDGLTTMFNLNTFLETRASGRHVPASVQHPKDIFVSLPLGLVGDPLSAATCTPLQLIGTGEEVETECPPASRVGTAVLFEEGLESGTLKPSGGGVSAVYNMTPDKSFPAQLGFKVLGQPVPLYASVVHTGSGYALRVGTPGIPHTLGIEGLALTLFGDPNLTNNEPSNPQAFFTDPSDCSAGPLTATIEANSWAEPGRWAVAKSVAYPHISGCDLLRFEPMVELHPEVTEAEAPSGFEIKIKAPQNPNRFPVLATPDLRDLTMTLPEGMTFAPGAADGLVACQATGAQGINMPGAPLHPDEVQGEGEEFGPDGVSHLVPGHCPAASQIGTVKITTPLLDLPLEGHVYVAQPLCGGEGQPECTPASAINGQLFGIYMEAEGAGVVVKLGGRVSVDPTTGRVTVRFTELPQQPLSEVTVQLKGGVRAPLADPRRCGPATVSADFTPWGFPASPAVPWSTSFAVDWDGNGTQCPATWPFAPTLQAGAPNAAAGHFSPLTAVMRRGDRTKDLAALQVRLPPGLLGMLSSVTLCREPYAAQGTCGTASEIGVTSAAVGSGPHPYVVNGGRVYLTEGFAGSPFGLTVVVPAKAGPFNLGNVVVRAAIDVDPKTSAVTITSEPLPQIRDGIPLRIQTLYLTTDRPGFTFNPTNCSRKEITATVAAAQGGSADISWPFTVEGCNSLPFKPTFAVSTQAKASKTNGAILKVKVTSAFGQDNIGRVLVSLPKQLPARLTTLQHACPEATFAQNPAQCPQASDVGIAKAITPVLTAALTGPAYLVSHGGAAFPDLVVILQGQGIRLDLTGNTSIAKGITTSSFASIPDAPVSRFELTLPTGPHSALTSNLPTRARQNFCATRLIMPTTLTAQNGTQVKQSTKIVVLGCPKDHKSRIKTPQAHGK
jgi:hypothetical protein